MGLIASQDRVARHIAKTAPAGLIKELQVKSFPQIGYVVEVAVFEGVDLSQEMQGTWVLRVGHESRKFEMKLKSAVASGRLFLLQGQNSRIPKRVRLNALGDQCPETDDLDEFIGDLQSALRGQS